MNPIDENSVDHNPIDEHWERQLNRALDGELGQDERLDLDRELIRRPDLRETLELSQRIDALAGEGLRSLLDREHGPHLTLPKPAREPVRRRYHRAWWLMPGVAAAAVLAALLLSSRPVEGPERFAGQGADRSRAPALPVPASSWEHSVPVNYQPTRINRQLGRDVYGVVGTDGNIYLIETDHLRTVKQPGGLLEPRLLGGDL